MKRDFDLVRLLLLNIEGESEVDLSGYNTKKIDFHKALLIDADFAEGIIHKHTMRIDGIPDYVDIKRLTWEGHEFIDKSRDVGVWEKAKNSLFKKGLVLSFFALKSALNEIIKAGM